MALNHNKQTCKMLPNNNHGHPGYATKVILANAVLADVQAFCSFSSLSNVDFTKIEYPSLLGSNLHTYSANATAGVGAS